MTALALLTILCGGPLWAAEVPPALAPAPTIPVAPAPLGEAPIVTSPVTGPEAPPVSLPTEVPIPEPRPAPKLELGPMSLGGSACTSSGEELQQSGGVLLVPLRAMVEKPAEMGQQRGVCALNLPVRVPVGFKLTIKKMQLRLITDLPTEGRAKARAEVFFAGSQGPFVEIEERSGRDRRLESRSLETAADFSTGCGESVNLRVNASVLVEAAEASATSQLDRLAIDYSVSACE